jgi:hypothetical protein
VPILESKMRLAKDLADVNSDLEIKNPQVSDGVALYRLKLKTTGPVGRLQGRYCRYH